MHTMDIKSRASQFADVLNTAQVTDNHGAVIETESAMCIILGILKEIRESGRSLFLIGNGGSAAVASHAVTDFLNVGKLRASTVHDSSLMTCMANDYGYEAAYARILSVLARPADVLIAISSSGRSPNIRNAVTAFRDAGGTTLTLSGFDSDNSLRSLGHYNIWLDSADYGFIEIGHEFYLHNLADRLRIGL